MAGFPEVGHGRSGVADRRDNRVQWQSSSARFEHKLQVLPQHVPLFTVAQCSPSSHSALAMDNPATLDQELKPTEQQMRVELERFRRGGGESDAVSSSSATAATEKKESEGNGSVQMVPYDPSMRSDSSQDVAIPEEEDPQSTNVVPEDVPDKLPPAVEYLSAFAHLTTFSFLGVLIRYGLRILFSDVARVTSSDSSLFIDLPANMVGCFFMGGVGVVFRSDLVAFSELLLIGLSTGLLGSITTYASWNQELLVLITNGFWVRSIVGLIVGMELSQMSLSVGMDTARLLRSGLIYMRRDQPLRGSQKTWDFTPDNLRRQQISLLVFLSSSFLLWATFVALTAIDTDSEIRRRLWLSCVVGPPGVWARWLLARLNGHGIGRNQYLKWLPVGTLLTNVVASTLEAVLATVLLASPEDASLLCTALQIGLFGCMSTVSTFASELYALHQSPKRWRAYAYFCLSFFCSYFMGALVYTLPVLVSHLSL